MDSETTTSLDLKDKTGKKDATSNLATAKPALDADLRARVQSLKISKDDKAGGNQRPSRLPWFISIVLAALLIGVISRDPSVIGLSQKEPVSETSDRDNDKSSGTNASAITGANNKAPNAETTSMKEDKNRNSGGKEKLATTSAAKLDPNAIVHQSSGYVVPRHQVLVSPQVSGRLMSLNIEEGRRVQKGEILAEVDRTEYEADANQLLGALERAKAELSELENGARPQELKSAEADMEEAASLVPQLEEEYKRLKQLYEAGNISASEFELAQSQFLSTRWRLNKFKSNLDMMREGPRKERISVAKAAVTQAQATYDKALWRLDNCTIRAPITGTILKKNAEQGNLVNPIAFNGSFSICDIADLSDLEIDLNIQERDVSKIFPGQRCEVRSEAFPKQAYPGVVSRLMPIADRAKGAVPVRVAVKVPEAEQGVYLKPEMSSLVVFFASKVDDESSAKNPPDESGSQEIEK